LPLVDEVVPHAAPSATHMPDAQQPLAQMLPAQQGEPTVPQTWQMPDVLVDEHTVPPAQRSVPFVPEQHCSPG
jgi:hypothetical protein